MLRSPFPSNASSSSQARPGAAMVKIPTLHVAPTPRIHVKTDTLDDGCALLVYNHPELFAMILDADAPAWKIAEALMAYGERAVDQGIWHRDATSPDPIAIQARTR